MAASRDGKFIEEIGTYQPRKKGHNYTLNLGRAKYWLSKGAQPERYGGQVLSRNVEGCGGGDDLSHPTADRRIPEQTNPAPIRTSMQASSNISSRAGATPRYVTVTPVEREGRRLRTAVASAGCRQNHRPAGNDDKRDPDRCCWRAAQRRACVARSKSLKKRPPVEAEMDFVGGRQMKIAVLTLFPGMFAGRWTKASSNGRVKQGLLELTLHICAIRA